MLDEPSRRNVLKLMGRSFALGGLTACRRPVEHILPFSRGVEDYIHGKPLYYNTVMSLGGAAMGLTAETNEGRPPRSKAIPITRGVSAGTRGYHQASVLSLYDPNRAWHCSTKGKNSDWDAFAGDSSEPARFAR